MPEADQVELRLTLSGLIEATREAQLACLLAGQLAAEDHLADAHLELLAASVALGLSPERQQGKLWRRRPR